VIQRYEALKERKLSDVLARMEAHELDALISGLGKVTLLIADKEAARTRCMRCSSYYARPCMLESRCGRCAYLQVRTASGAIGLPAVDLPGPG
jgi:hypothetical protein